MTLYKQCNLEYGETRMTTWLDTSWKWRRGDYVRLRDDDRLWRIKDVYGPSLEKAAFDRRWHVGGL